MNRFYFKTLFLFLLNICVHGFPTLKKKKPEPYFLMATPVVLDYHRSKEMEKSLKARHDPTYHSEQSERKFVLNPARLYHKKQVARADRSINIHNENGKQLLMAETTGIFKVTKSKSGKHDHYQARLPYMQ